MLKTRSGDIIGSSPPQVEAVSVETAARLAELGRSTLYKALHPDPKKREGLPFLASLKVGKSRRVRVPALRAWLLELEATASRHVA